VRAARRAVIIVHEEEETAMKRLLCWGVIALGLVASTAWGQAWPSRPIKLVVPFAPGGSADAIARPLAERLSVLLGQPVVVENKGGGLTAIAGDMVAKSPPDGYTLYFATATHVLLPYLVQKLPFDPMKDFTHIALMGVQPQLFLSHPGQPFATFNDMVAYARANPGKLSIGISDAVSRANAELLKSALKLDFAIVNYKGGGPLATDLLAGHVPVGLGTPVLYTPYAKDRKMNALAVTIPRRLSFLPDVPTVAELTGIQNFDIATWYVVSAPAGLPTPIVDRIQREVSRVAAEPDMRRRLVDLGVEPPENASPAATTAQMKSYMDRVGAILQASGTKPE